MVRTRRHEQWNMNREVAVFSRKVTIIRIPVSLYLKEGVHGACYSVSRYSTHAFGRSFISYLSQTRE